MTIFGICYGAALVILGVFGYIKSGGDSITALIPAFLGSPIIIFSLLSLKPKFLKVGMHVNVVIALAGFVATFKDTLSLLSGQEFDNELAAYSKALTCILSFLFIICSVVSFVGVSRAKKNSV